MNTAEDVREDRATKASWAAGTPPTSAVGQSRSSSAVVSPSMAARSASVRPGGPRMWSTRVRARRLLQRLTLVQIDDELLDAAAMADPRVLRSLDAVHLAAAQLIGDELTALVTYDRRMSAAASLIDLTTPPSTAKVARSARTPAWV